MFIFAQECMFNLPSSDIGSSSSQTAQSRSGWIIERSVVPSEVVIVWSRIWKPRSRKFSDMPSKLSSFCRKALGCAAIPALKTESKSRLFAYNGPLSGPRLLILNSSRHSTHDVWQADMAFVIRSYCERSFCHRARLSMEIGYAWKSTLCSFLKLDQNAS